MFGLSVDTLRRIKKVFSKFPKIQKVILYGSRAKGNYKKGSDIDITLIGKGLTLENTVYPLMEELDELYLPYKFDISIFNQLEDSDLIDHILRVGKTFYRKGCMGIEKWPVFPLEDLCEFYNGLWKGKKPPFVHVGVIRNTNFTKSGFLDDNDIAYLDVEEKQFSKRQLQFGDLILEKSGGGPKQPVGRVITFEKAEGLFSFSNFTSLIRVADPLKLSFHFLHRLLYWYYISRVTEGMQRRSTGIRNLDFSAYKRLPVPLPSIPEQKRIVAILDEAFTAIETVTANTEKNLTNARELFESELARVFQKSGDGGSMMTLGDLCEFRRGLTYEKSDEVSASQNAILRANNITVETGKINFDEIRHIRDEVEIPDLKMIKPGCLLICIASGSKKHLGKAGLVEDGSNYAFGGFMGLIVPSKQLLAKYLFWLTRSSFYRDFITNLSEGTNINNLKWNQLSQFLVPTPPLPEQKRVVEFLDKLSAKQQALISIYETKINALSELEQSLLHMAFTGELTADKSATGRTLSEVGV